MRASTDLLDTSEWRKWKRFATQGLKHDKIIAVSKLWAIGDLRFLMHPGQTLMYELLIKPEHQIAVACTSRQYGKTTFALICCLMACLQKANQTVIFAGPYSGMAARSTENTMRDLLLSCPVALAPKKSRSRYRFPNGSTLELTGVNIDAGDRQRGQSAHFVVIDEAREINDLENMVESVFLPMFTTTNGKLLIVSTPPESISHPFTARFIKDAIANEAFFRADFSTNVLLSEQQLETTIKTIKGGVESVQFKREWGADYTVSDDSSRVLPSYDSVAHQAHLEEIGIPATYEPYVGIDLGQKDNTGIVFCAMDRLNDRIVALGEAQLKNPTTREIYEAIRFGEATYFSGNPNEPVRISDIDLRLIIDLRRDYNVTIRPVVKESALAMLNKLDDSLGKFRTIVSPELTPKLAFECETGVRKKTRDGQFAGMARVESEGSHLDLMDALKYVERMAIRHATKKQIPTREYSLGVRVGATASQTLNTQREKQKPIFINPIFSRYTRNFNG